MQTLHKIKCKIYFWEIILMLCRQRGGSRIWIRWFELPQERRTSLNIVLDTPYESRWASRMTIMATHSSWKVLVASKVQQKSLQCPFHWACRICSITLADTNSAWFASEPKHHCQDGMCWEDCMIGPVGACLNQNTSGIVETSAARKLYDNACNLIQAVFKMMHHQAGSSKTRHHILPIECTAPCWPKSAASSTVQADILWFLKLDFVSHTGITAGPTDPALNPQVVKFKWRPVLRALAWSQPPLHELTVWNILRETMLEFKVASKWQHVDLFYDNL